MNRMNQFIQGDTSRNVESFKLQKVNIKHIKENEKNLMPMENIEDLKESIKSHGLQEKIVVRPIKDSEDLKERYMIISGHRRYKALKELNEETGEYKAFDVLINNDIETEFDERVAIAVGNAHREEKANIKYIKTKEWGIIYEELVKTGEIKNESGNFKSNWIGERMNRSGRTIRTYWDDMNLKNKGTEEKTDEELQRSNAKLDKRKKTTPKAKLLRNIRILYKKINNKNNEALIENSDDLRKELEKLSTNIDKLLKF